jgi:hypothetical protein
VCEEKATRKKTSGEKKSFNVLKKIEDEIDILPKSGDRQTLGVRRGNTLM